MLIREEMPRPVISEVKRHLNGDAGIKIAVSSDLELDGTLGEVWLLATDKRIIVLEKNGGTPRVLHNVPFTKLREVTCEGQVGNGYLKATVDKRLVRLIRYSNSHAQKFAVAAKYLDMLTRGEEPVPHKEEEILTRCPKCGFPLQHSTSCINCVKKKQALLRLMSYMKPYKWSGLFVFSLLLLSVFLSLIPPYLCKLLMDNVLPGDNKRLLTLVVTGLIMAAALSTLLSVVHGRIGSWMGAKAIHTIRMSLCEHIERFSLSYFDKRQTGDVMGRVNYDTLELQGFLTFEVFFFASQLVQLAGGIIIVLGINWKLGLLALLPTPFTVLFAVKMAKGLRKVHDRFWHRRGQFGTVLTDSLHGMKIVKAFGQEDTEIERLRRSSEGFMVASAKSDSAWNTLIPSFVFIVSSGTFLVWWMGGYQVINEQMTVGDLMATLGYIGLISGPIQVVVRMGDRMTRVLAAAERIFEVLDTPTEEPDTGKSVSLPDIKGRVEFRNVTFGYEPHDPVLHNISLDVKPGEMIGLVGHSGAGKSTTINLICRFYTAQEGELLIDGVNIKDIRLSDLRKQIGVVPQDPYLFNGTVGENIAYSKPYAPMEEIIQAAKAANAHDFIVGFQDGYETWVGEGGQRLSAGERQRIAIARAILRNPRILILDEATSSIDTGTEKQIQEALARLVKNRTTFAIAHRLSTLKNADRLVVLDHGHIVEHGTHDELMNKKGTYHNLVEMQSQMSQIRAVDG